jgi:hypothetical protein
MKRLISGNEAIFQGAIKAGASYFAGYPISPTSEILQQAATYAEEDSKFRFLQAEDEIAAAIATISASLAGAKAFTATSGPGFSLMQEALGWGRRGRGSMHLRQFDEGRPVHRDAHSACPVGPASDQGRKCRRLLSDRLLSPHRGRMLPSDRDGLQCSRRVSLTGYPPRGCLPLPPLRNRGSGGTRDQFFRNPKHHYTMALFLPSPFPGLGTGNNGSF